MSDAPDAAPKKKKGKLPVIIALVAVLAGGGFFMMKSKGGKEEKKESEIKMAKAEVILADEYLVNMADGRSYVRCKVALKVKEGFDPHDVEAHTAEVSDAINMTLKGTDPKDCDTAEGMKKLKRRIAAAINAIMPAHGEEDGGDSHGEKKSGPTTSVKLKDKKKEEHSDHGDEEMPPDWDSLHGPVLKVLFVAFATQ